MKKKVAILGCGNLGSMIAESIACGLIQGHEIVGIYDVDPSTMQRLAGKARCPWCPSLEEMLSLMPDYVVECTTPEVLQQTAFTILGSRARLIVLSAGAFSDPEFTRKAVQCALDNGTVIHIASGAIGGFDLMHAARLMGHLSICVRNQKPPEGLNGAPFLQGRILDPKTEETIFTGSAREAIAVFPKNVNVAVAAALAAADVDTARVEVCAVPHLPRNTHEITLNGAFGQATLTIASVPSPDNPRSSALAAYSVLALLEKLNSPLQFG